MAAPLDLEQYRAAFERLCRQNTLAAGDDASACKFEHNADGSYQDVTTQAAWWGYREGLKAALAQVPAPPAQPNTGDWPEDHSLYGDYFGTNIGGSPRSAH